MVQTRNGAAVTAADGSKVLSASPCRLRRVRRARWLGSRNAPGLYARLTLHQRLLTKIAEIERKQVECPQVESVQPDPTTRASPTDGVVGARCAYSVPAVSIDTAGNR